MTARKDFPVAYFCAEFAVDAKIPTYAGGLGVLAGDLVKAASEENFPLIGIGLIYKGIFFVQKITQDGLQVEENAGFDPETSMSLRRVTLRGKPVMVEIDLGEKVFVAAYQLRLGEVTTVYFLTTDIEENSDEWRYALDSDYCCGADVELRQQLILGLGGVKLLKILGIRPYVYHFNEGRPCFAVWEVARQIAGEKKVSFEKALVQARTKIVYTNHTLMPSGNLVYDLNLVERYAQKYAQGINVDLQLLIKEGKEPENKGQSAQAGFGITRYALASSRKATAVSKLHFDFCIDYWKGNWSYVTNGVHMGTWQNYKFADKSVGDSDLWLNHIKLKDTLLREVIERTGFGYNPKRLVVGWARRIADYKRFEGIFEDVLRLSRLIKSEGREVQILLAGKAHVGDAAAVEAIKKVIGFMKGELSGNAIFVPNYDLELARKMVAGVDVWLNTPIVGQEACGTSGMKALANGVLNLTTKDGWVAEVDLSDAGWILDDANLAESFYTLLDKEVLPQFYNRSEEGMPIGWVKKMRNSIELSERFDIRKTLEDYKQKLYD